MYFHSDSVTQRMSEEISITRFINNIPCITVKFTAGYSRYEKTMSAYKVAVQEKYRFFSFGDAMFIQ